MLVVLKGTHPEDGPLCNEFTLNEQDTAVAISEIWHLRGWRPRLFVKSFDGRFQWLTSLPSHRKAA